MSLATSQINKPAITTIGGDIMGGITAAVASLPLALAFGVSSGLGAQAGLYGAIGLGLFAAIFGGTKGLISAPTGPMTAVSTIIIGQLVAQLGSVDSALGSIMLAFIIAGLSQIVFGFLRIGQFVHFIPYPVVSGFMTGVGAIIILMQIAPFLGVTGGKVDIIQMMYDAVQGTSKSLTLGDAFAQTNWNAVAVALATVAIIIVSKKITTKVPGSLIALVIMTALSSYVLQLDIPKIGQIPEGLPKLVMPELNMAVFSIVLAGGIQLGALGVLDTLLTSVIGDSLTKTRHNPNKELIGQGLGQIAAAFVGGLPGAGTTTCTVINIKAGGYSWVSGTTNALLLIALLLGAGSLAAQIPNAVLAGILLKVGTDIIDYQGFRYAKVAPKSDTVIMLVVLALTVAVDLIVAVAVGMILALIMFMKEMSDIMKIESKTMLLDEYLYKHDLTDWLKAITASNPTALKRTTIKTIQGPLFFGHVPAFQEKLSVMQDMDTLVILMDRVPYMDEAGIHAFKESTADLKNKGIQVVLIGIQPRPMQMLRESGICATFPADDALMCEEQHIYSSIDVFLKQLVTPTAAAPEVLA